MYTFVHGTPLRPRHHGPGDGGSPQLQRWIYSILRPCFGHRILEIGPGFGGIASHVIEDRKEYSPINVDPNVILRLRAHLGLGEDKLAIGDISSSKWIESFKTADAIRW